jgi:hypothetical protein
MSAFLSLVVLLSQFFQWLSFSIRHCFRLSVSLCLVSLFSLSFYFLKSFINFVTHLSIFFVRILVIQLIYGSMCHGSLLKFLSSSSLISCHFKIQASLSFFFSVTHFSAFQNLVFIPFVLNFMSWVFSSSFTSFLFSHQVSLAYS